MVPISCRAKAEVEYAKELTRLASKLEAVPNDGDEYVASFHCFEISHSLPTHHPLHAARVSLFCLAFGDSLRHRTFSSVWGEIKEGAAEMAHAHTHFSTKITAEIEPVAANYLATNHQWQQAPKVSRIPFFFYLMLGF